MARPRPVPPYWRVVEESAWVNFSNRVRILRLGDADAGVGDRQPQAAGVRRLEAGGDMALVGELDGVGDEVGEDLAQPVGVAAPDAGGFGVDFDRESQPLVLGHGAKPSRTACGHAARCRSRWSASSSLPASILERSSTSLSTASSCSPDWRTTVSRSRCTSARSPRSITSAIASTPFSGVRISWLMLARNCDLAMLAALAASRASIRSSSVSQQLLVVGVDLGEQVVEARR